VERYLDDRRLFIDTFYRYYADHEGDHSWVACADGEVVGFLMGCLNTEQQRRRLAKENIPQVVWGMLNGQYGIGRRTIRYGFHLARAVLHQEIPEADFDLYPAHLHLNLAAPWRGFGLGRQLLLAYLAQLRALNVPGVHLDTTSVNQAACHLYEAQGFRLLEQRRTRLWEGLVVEAVYARTYGMRLAKISS
jgi:GNAT superfamily N-acetyltransferase